MPRSRSLRKPTHDWRTPADTAAPRTPWPNSCKTAAFSLTRHDDSSAPPTPGTACLSPTTSSIATSIRWRPTPPAPPTSHTSQRPTDGSTSRWSKTCSAAGSWAGSTRPGPAGSSSMPWRWRFAADSPAKPARPLRLRQPVRQRTPPEHPGSARRVWLRSRSIRARVPPVAGLSTPSQREPPSDRAQPHGLGPDRSERKRGILAREPSPLPRRQRDGRHSSPPRNASSS